MDKQDFYDRAHPSSAAPLDGRESTNAVSVVFQLRYLIRVGLTITCGVAVSMAITHFVLTRDLGTYDQSISIISSVRGLIMGSATISGLIQLGLFGILIAALALFASHKIVGPTVRVERLLREIGSGPLPGPIRFRRDDQVGVGGARQSCIPASVGTTRRAFQFSGAPFSASIR